MFLLRALRRYSNSLDTATYNRLADQLLDHLHDSIDTAIDSHPLSSQFDTSLAMGVLTIKLADLGTFVVNKQPPNLQIWLSSPISGPSRYDLVKGEWVYKRDNVELTSRLSGELTTLLQQSIQLPKLHYK